MSGDPMIVPTTAAVLSRLRANLEASWRGLWSWLVSDAAANYQPERYYMRGPGPKWREKHGPRAR
jgi:hypothetical protein